MSNSLVDGSHHRGVIKLDYSRPLLKVKQVAARLGITERDVYKLIKTNQLHAFHLGRMIRIHEDGLAEYQSKLAA